MGKFIKFINQLLGLTCQTCNEIIIVIHSAMDMDEQWFPHTF